MTVAGDAFGRALYDAWLGRGRGYHIIEREDGLLDAMESNAYFRPPAAWEPFERQALRYARGRVLDIGCGAGRHALYLQQRHLHVLGIDISPLAVRVARARGLRRAKVALAARIPLSWGPFGTILMLGNNFGLLENRVRGRRLLRHLFRMTTAQGRILAGERPPSIAAIIAGTGVVAGWGDRSGCGSATARTPHPGLTICSCQGLNCVRSCVIRDGARSRFCRPAAPCMSPCWRKSAESTRLSARPGARRALLPLRAGRC